METVVNNKLDSYFYRNKVFVGYLKVMKYSYLFKQIALFKHNQFNYEKLITDINFVINKQIAEEGRLEDIVRAINTRVAKYQAEGLEEIYSDLIEVVDILNKSIDISDQFIEGSIMKHKMHHKGIKYEATVNRETIEGEQVANHFNQKMLKKDIIKKK
ncbi:MAG: hypothetical protein PHI05_04155 [Bacilli bacterium]|nr:hypothetical protein [Bacilli bacterium]MDD4547914.1 hypothetical protein [Bacilli bacterium]